MANIELNNALMNARKQKAFAWAKYFEQVNGELQNDHIIYKRYERIINDEIPHHIKEELKEMGKELHKKWECPICMEMIADNNLDITNCGHYFCKGCLESYKKTQKENGEEKWKCAVCRRKHNYK
jgi:ubiquitin C-terminal hydrolase